MEKDIQIFIHHKYFPRLIRNDMFGTCLSLPKWFSDDQVDHSTIENSILSKAFDASSIEAPWSKKTMIGVKAFSLKHFTLQVLQEKQRAMYMWLYVQRCLSFVYMTIYTNCFRIRKNIFHVRLNNKNKIIWFYINLWLNNRFIAKLLQEKMMMTTTTKVRITSIIIKIIDSIQQKHSVFYRCFVLPLDFLSLSS